MVLLCNQNIENMLDNKKAKAKSKIIKIDIIKLKKEIDSYIIKKYGKSRNYNNIVKDISKYIINKYKTKGSGIIGRVFEAIRKATPNPIKIIRNHLMQNKMNQMSMNSMNRSMPMSMNSMNSSMPMSMNSMNRSMPMSMNSMGNQINGTISMPTNTLSRQTSNNNSVSIKGSDILEIANLYGRHYDTFQKSPEVNKLMLSLINKIKNTNIMMLSMNPPITALKNISIDIKTDPILIKDKVLQQDFDNFMKPFTNITIAKISYAGNKKRNINKNESKKEKRNK